ncbi:Uncharacterized membrane protein [Roseateles sp. YR242]|uniref:DUF1440 domain-containing protein n=1 Tax=Roseateles sp. YR242 TaxID=1855305 RepID=UPI0008AED011|nr:DUF1440 domain-containing protein [Roseateles sp. YR242]SEL23258.1 Uncharacterized membrane protein [Roseateles sp. YR242]
MDIQHNEDGEPLLGLASGLAAGLVGALVMTGFQALLARGGITSGVKGPPSTEKAANLAARLATGRPVPARRRAAAGEAVHYAMGSAVGGIYGVAAEILPQVNAGQGAAFGVVAATVVDETLVPAFRFGDPIWKAPVVSHPYSYASHLVYGTFTEGARKLFRRFFGQVKAGAVEVGRSGWTLRSALATGSAMAARPTGPLASADSAASASSAAPAPRASRRKLLLAFMLGATAGPRTSAPLVAASWAARLGLIPLHGSPLAFLATTRAVGVTTPMAVGELVVDKLPSTPDRTQPVGVVARVTSGALSGAALAGGRSAAGALAGAAGAIVATYVGHTIRTRVSRAFGNDWAIAVTEDLLAFGGAALVCVAAVAPETAPQASPAPTGETAYQ